uniref:DUF6090 family protein n=1 Tax=Flavobacterium sp. TaxID=239 RepID=UPI004049E254
MLKFFRKIRQNLLRENKIVTYLKYAFGEIVLVVIGILIALSINNWNQNRIENDKEQIALQNLKQDFDFNYTTLNSSLTLTQKSKENELMMLKYTGNKPKPQTEAEFNNLLNNALGFREFFPINSSLDELLSSGELKIIKNQKLRRSLSSWYPVYESILSQEKTVLREINEITKFIMNKGSWLNTDAVTNAEEISTIPFPKSGFDVDNRDLLNELAFENLIENTIYQNEILMIKQKQGLTTITEIKTLINQEIEE